MAFLVANWDKLQPHGLVDSAHPAVNRSTVLDRTIEMIGDREGQRLEFGVWQGKSIKRCAEAFPQHHWFGFDSFEGFPDDGRVDWQKPFKVIELPDTPSNVTLVKGYFSETLDPFLVEHQDDPLAFINIDCDIYSSTVDIFAALEKHQKLKPGLVIYFDELINYSDYMWNESLALFEMLERTGLGLKWHFYDQNLRTPRESVEMFHSGDHPTWMDDMRSGYWMQATCELTDEGVDLGPVDDAGYRALLTWMVEGVEKQNERRLAALAEREERLKEIERERERRYLERKKLEKERQLQNLERRRAEKQAEKERRQN